MPISGSFASRDYRQRILRFLKSERKLPGLRTFKESTNRPGIERNAALPELCRDRRPRGPFFSQPSYLVQVRPELALERLRMPNSAATGRAQSRLRQSPGRTALDRIRRFVAILHASVAELFEDVVAEGFPLRQSKWPSLLCSARARDTPKNPDSSSVTLTADVVEVPLEWHARLAGSTAVPQSVELLEPA